MSKFQKSQSLYLHLIRRWSTNMLENKPWSRPNRVIHQLTKLRNTMKVELTTLPVVVVQGSMQRLLGNWWTDMSTINQTDTSMATKTAIITLIEAIRIDSIEASLVTPIITGLLGVVLVSMISKISRVSMSTLSSKLKLQKLRKSSWAVFRRMSQKKVSKRQSDYYRQMYAVILSLETPKELSYQRS